MSDWKETLAAFKMFESMGVIKIKKLDMLKLIIKGASNLPPKKVVPIVSTYEPEIICPDVSSNESDITANNSLIAILIITQILLWVVVLYG